MATFKGRDGIEWKVELDVPTIEEVEEKHSIDLVDLEKDPLVQLRGAPRKMASVIYLICQKQIQTQGLDPRQFAEQLPYPPDPMYEALKEAIVGFFPTGRASHVRGVLAKNEEMSNETDKIKIEQMEQVLADPRTMERVRSKVGMKRQELLDALFETNSQPGE